MSIQQKTLLEHYANCPKLLVYGSNHCGYSELSSMLQSASCRSELVTTYYRRASGKTPLLAHPFCTATIQQESSAVHVHMLTQRVFANWQRTLAGKSIVPILFCIDCSDNPYPFTMQNLSSNRGAGLFTKIEIRHGAQLCLNPQLDSRIRAMAWQSFVFIKVIFGEGDFSPIVGLEKIRAPWENPDWHLPVEALKVDKERHSKALNPKWESILNFEVEQHSLRLLAQPSSQVVNDDSIDHRKVDVSLRNGVPESLPKHTDSD